MRDALGLKHGGEATAKVVAQSNAKFVAEGFVSDPFRITPVGDDIDGVLERIPCFD